MSNYRRVARNSQWEGANLGAAAGGLWGLVAKLPAAGGWRSGGQSPQRSKILHFFCKKSLILLLF